MKEFILRALKTKTSPFNTNDLINAGRMDIVCDCVISSLFISNNVRQDTIFHVILEGPRSPPKLISFFGNEIKGLDYDQKSIAEIINQALKQSTNLKLSEEINLKNGIKISKKSFEALVKEKSRTSQLIYLNHKGQDIRNFEFQENITFIFGDYIGMPRKTEKLLERLGAKKVNLGPKKLFASHCIVIAHNELDRAN